MLENKTIVPDTHELHEKQTAEFCLCCAESLVFDKNPNVFRWRCPDESDCGWIHWNSPMPVVNAVVPFPKEYIGETNVSGPFDFDVQQFSDPSQTGTVQVQRGIQPFQHEWCDPCGFVNEGEDPLHAVIREAAEETRLRIQALRYLGACNPLHSRMANLRFHLNQIVMSYLGLPHSGVMEAADDAEDIRIADSERSEELCFSSHTFVTKHWHRGTYALKNLEAPSLLRVPENVKRKSVSVDHVRYCTRCAVELIFNEKHQRKSCPSTGHQEWVYWNSPVPFIKLVLSLPQKRGDVLLYRSEKGWRLPQGPIRSYQTPNDTACDIARYFGLKMSVEHNLEAFQPSSGLNEMFIGLQGNVTGKENGIEKSVESQFFDLQNLPPLGVDDKRVLERWENGTYEEIGSVRLKASKKD